MLYPKTFSDAYQHNPLVQMYPLTQSSIGLTFCFANVKLALPNVRYELNAADSYGALFISHYKLFTISNPSKLLVRCIVRIKWQIYYKHVSFHAVCLFLRPYP